MSFAQVHVDEFYLVVASCLVTTFNSCYYLYPLYRSVYGLYVIDECNIETHGMKPYVGRLADDPRWTSAYMQRLTRLFHRDRAHTCVIGWSLGNEAGYGAVHDAMAAWIREKDPTRIVMYEPASYGPRGDCQVTSVTGPETVHGGAIKPPAQVTCLPITAASASEDAPWALFGLFSSVKAENTTTAESKKDTRDKDAKVATDVICPMYARVEECVQLSKLFPTMPLIQCEYAHMMGESCN